MVRRLTHNPDCEGSIPTGYGYFRHHFKNLYIYFLVMILFLVYFNFDEKLK